VNGLGNPSRRQILAGAGGFAAATLVGARVRADDPKVIRIGYLKSLTPLNIGRLRGTVAKALAARGYTVQWAGPFPAFAPAVEALTPGSIDITEGSATSASSAMVAGAPFKIFAYALPSADAEGVIVRPDSGITTIPQLIGKRVAVNRGGSGEYLLALALSKHGIAYDKVDRVYLGPSDGAYAFSTGAVVGWSVWDPYFAIAQIRDKARTLAVSHAIGDENATIVVARNSLIAEQPEAVRAVFDALIVENTWAKANPAAAAALYAADAKVDQATANVLASRAPVTYTAVNATVTASLHRVASWFADQKIIPTVPDVQNFVYHVG
jgi:sulfonate transport system substrate-binding protein